MANARVKIRESLRSSVLSASPWNTDGTDEHGKTQIRFAFSCRRQDSKFGMPHVRYRITQCPYRIQFLR